MRFIVIEIHIKLRRYLNVKTQKKYLKQITIIYLQQLAINNNFFSVRESYDPQTSLLAPQQLGDKQSYFLYYIYGKYFITSKYMLVLFRLLSTRVLALNIKEFIFIFILHYIPNVGSSPIGTAQTQ